MYNYIQADVSVVTHGSYHTYLLSSHIQDNNHQTIVDKKKMFFYPNFICEDSSYFTLFYLLVKKKYCYPLDTCVMSNIHTHLNLCV